MEIIVINESVQLAINYICQKVNQTFHREKKIDKERQVLDSVIKLRSEIRLLSKRVFAGQLYLL